MRGGNEAFRFEIMRFTNAINHGSNRANLGLPNGPRWLNIKDDRVRLSIAMPDPNAR